MTTGEGLVTTREGQVTTEEGAFLALSKSNPSSSRPYVFCVPSHDLAAPSNWLQVGATALSPALVGRSSTPHRPARQRGGCGKKPEVFITED